MCFLEDPNERARFSDVITIVEKELTTEEKLYYENMYNKYQDERAKNYIKLGQKILSQPQSNF